MFLDGRRADQERADVCIGEGTSGRERPDLLPRLREAGACEQPRSRRRQGAAHAIRVSHAQQRGGVMGRRRGFTLVELLAVTGIISLLISILLPVLGRARETANSLKCQANLRSIAQAMMIYCSENGGYIPGSALTSARHLWEDSGGTFSLRPGVSDSNVPPPVIELYDYIGPLSRIMKLAVSETSSTVQRLKEYRELAAFKCPSNEGIIATRFSGPA